LEKLLQKNHFLHQSAKDGYRSYLQAYASYSLKKIFDVNKLDLAKVGRAFGFSVPPRVNITVGGGTGGTGKSGIKRKRENDDDDAGGGLSEGDATSAKDTEEVVFRSQTKNKRKDQLGKKTVDKEIYRKQRPKQDGVQWSS
jgi:ATP-dependent RNA helicase DDX18/HAS1